MRLTPDHNVVVDICPEPRSVGAGTGKTHHRPLEKLMETGSSSLIGGKRASNQGLRIDDSYEISAFVQDSRS